MDGHLDSGHARPGHGDFRKAAAIAKWGAACAPCATAKAKCIRSNPAQGAKCDRCDRLYKDCAEQVHRPRKKRQSKPSRTAQIEERLNGLVNLLRASGEIPALDHDLGTTDTSCIPALTDHNAWDRQRAADPLGGSGRAAATAMTGPDGLSLGPGGNLQPNRIPETYNCYAPPTCICRPATNEAPPPPDTDDNLLAIYQNELAPVFPFVIIPSHVTASHLRATRPFLMSAIRMVASFTSMKSMRAQMYRLVTHLADHLLLRAERSLDLLAGIVVVLGWYHYHCLMHAQMHSLLHLAVCLVGELGLHRHPGLLERQIIMILQPVEPRSRTNEERRLLLAVWYLNSGISSIFVKTDPMRHTRYMRQCADELEAAAEFESDALLLAYIRVQHLTERIARLHAPEDQDDDAAAPGIPRAPAAAYVAAFRAELDRLRAGLPKHLRSNKLLEIHLNTAMLRLYEPPVVDAALLRRLASSLTALGPPGTSSALDIFYQSSSALKTWFDAWLDVPAAAYYSIPQPTFSQLIYAMTMVGRWAKYAAPQFAAAHRKRRAESAAASAAGVPAPPAEEPLPHDPSANNPNVALALEDAALNPSPAAAAGPGMTPTASGSSATAVSSAGSPQIPLAGSAPASTSTSTAPQYQLRDQNPDLPSAVRALRAQLAAQPNLVLDIPEMLRAIWRRAEEANAAMMQAAVEPGAWDNSVWGLGIAKVRITLAKLEQFAELVAARRAHGDDGGEGSEGTESGEEEEEDEDEGMSAAEGATTSQVGWEGLGTQHVPETGTGMGLAPEQQSFLDAWSNDLFAGMDPALWLDGTGDWGSIIMSGMDGSGGP